MADQQGSAQTGSVSSGNEKSGGLGKFFKSSSTSKNETDVETGEQEQGLNRDLHGRHLQFIAIGAALGTGLFLGIGPVLFSAGPGSLLISFLFVGLVVYSVMVGLGEMAAFLPVSGSFAVYASRFIDPTLGFSMGWIYWFSWVITWGLELTAAGRIIKYWDADLSIGIWIAVFWLIFTATNFLPVRWFGEIEMWLSSIKVVTVIGFVIFSICVNAGVGTQGYIGFKYWREPGAFREYSSWDSENQVAVTIVSGATGKFVAFWATLVTAGFSFQGTELVGVGAGETSNPRKTIPSAIRWTFWGIFGLFISTVFFVGINVPYDNIGLGSGGDDASASPLVIIANLAGVKVLPDIINAVLLTAVLSAANSDLYSSSRVLVGLAEEGHAPAFFKKTNRYGTPYWSVMVCTIFGFLGFLNLNTNAEVVFTWLLNITAVAGFITWALINACHIRFRKILRAQKIDLSELPYIAPFNPWLSWFGMIFNVLILITSGFTVFISWDVSSFFAAYVSILIFAVSYIGHKLIFRTKVIPLEDVDLSGRSG